MTSNSSSQPTNSRNTKPDGPNRSSSPETPQAPAPTETSSNSVRSVLGSKIQPQSELPNELAAFFFDRLNFERQSSVPYSERTYRLQPLLLLLEKLKDPHLLPVVHVAGTKGKGSVATFIQRAMVESGYRVGLFTSPHVRCLTERFVVDRSALTIPQLTVVVDELRPAVEAIDLISSRDREFGTLTFFDVCTAAAFVAFRQQKVDFAAIEVGLGGRLDSTNVVQPVVSVITSISFDHTAQLGNTLELIASEKAGIIKSGVPVVSGVLTPKAQKVILEKGKQLNCPTWQAGRDMSWNANPGKQPDSFNIEFNVPRLSGFEQIRLAMPGLHQRDNCLLAVAALRVIQQAGWEVDDDAIATSLSNTVVAGRIQIMDSKPLTIFDAAHNPASFNALIATLKHLYQPETSAAKRRIVFAASKDKDYTQLLQMAAAYFDQILFCQYVGNPRGVETATLLEQWDQVTAELRQQDREVFQSPMLAFTRGKALSTDEDLLVVAGSVFLLGEV